MRKTFWITLLLCSFNMALAGELRTLKWEEMVPADAPPLPPPTALHDLNQLADILAAESGPAAEQQHPNAPVVPELDGLKVKLPGYIVPLVIDDTVALRSFYWCPTLAPASMYHHRHPTKLFMCTAKAVSPWAICGNPTGSKASSVSSRLVVI